MTTPCLPILGYGGEKAVAVFVPDVGSSVEEVDDGGGSEETFFSSAGVIRARLPPSAAFFLCGPPVLVSRYVGCTEIDIDGMEAERTERRAAISRLLVRDTQQWGEWDINKEGMILAEYLRQRYTPDHDIFVQVLLKSLPLEHTLQLLPKRYEFLFPLPSSIPNNTPITLLLKALLLKRKSLLDRSGFYVAIEMLPEGFIAQLISSLRMRSGTPTEGNDEGFIVLKDASFVPTEGEREEVCVNDAYPIATPPLLVVGYAAGWLSQTLLWEVLEAVLQETTVQSLCLEQHASYSHLLFTAAARLCSEALKASTPRITALASQTPDPILETLLSHPPSADLACTLLSAKYSTTPEGYPMPWRKRLQEAVVHSPEVVVPLFNQAVRAGLMGGEEGEGEEVGEFDCLDLVPRVGVAVAARLRAGGTVLGVPLEWAQPLLECIEKEVAGGSAVYTPAAASSAKGLLYIAQHAADGFSPECWDIMKRCLTQFLNVSQDSSLRCLTAPLGKGQNDAHQRQRHVLACLLEAACRYLVSVWDVSGGDVFTKEVCTVVSAWVREVLLHVKDVHMQEGGVHLSLVEAVLPLLARPALCVAHFVNEVCPLQIVKSCALSAVCVPGAEGLALQLALLQVLAEAGALFTPGTPCDNAVYNNADEAAVFAHLFLLPSVEKLCRGPLAAKDTKEEEVEDTETKKKKKKKKAKTIDTTTTLDADPLPGYVNNEYLLSDMAAMVGDVTAHRTVHAFARVCVALTASFPGCMQLLSREVLDRHIVHPADTPAFTSLDALLSSYLFRFAALSSYGTEAVVTHIHQQVSAAEKCVQQQQHDAQPKSKNKKNTAAAPDTEVLQDTALLKELQLPPSDVVRMLHCDVGEHLSGIMWALFLHRFATPACLAEEPPSSFADFSFTQEDLNALPPNAMQRPGFAAMGLFHSSETAAAACETLIAVSPTRTLHLIAAYVKRHTTFRIPPTVLAKCSAYFLLPAEEVPQMHAIHAVDILHSHIRSVQGTDVDAPTSTLFTKVTQSFDKVLSSLGKYGTCKLPTWHTAASVRGSILSSVAAVLLHPTQTGLKVPSDPKFYKKLLSFATHTADPDTANVLSILQVLVTASDGKEVAKVADMLISHLITTLQALHADSSQGKTCLDTILSLSAKGTSFRGIIMTHREVLSPILTEVGSVEHKETIESLLKDFTVQAEKEELQRVQREAEEEERMRVEMEQQEADRIRREEERRIELEERKKKDEKQRKLEEEVRMKMEAEKKRREEVERKRREKEQEAIRAAQREENERRREEEESRKVREKEKQERDKIIAQTQETLTQLTSVGVNLTKAKLAMRECQGHDIDILIEWIVQTSDDATTAEQQLQMASSTARVESIQVSGSGAVKTVMKAAQTAQSSTAGTTIAPPISSFEMLETDGDDYQDFWAIDVDLSKNLQPVELEEEDEVEACDAAENAQFFASNDNEEEEEQRHIAINPHMQEDYKKKFLERMEQHEKAHPKHNIRRQMPPWHARLAHALDVLDFEGNQRCHFSDVKMFIQKDLGIRGFHHLGFKNAREYLDNVQEKGVLKITSEGGKELVYLTRFGKRYHEKYWHASSSVKVRKPIEEAARAERRELRKSHSAAARRRALEALLQINAGDDGEEVDPDELEIPDWVLDAEIEDETVKKKEMTPEEIERAKERGEAARIQRLKRIIREMESKGKPVVKRQKPKQTQQNVQPTISAAEVAKQNRVAAEQRVQLRRTAEKEARQREADAEKAKKRANQKRAKEAEVFFTPHRQLLAFCICVVLFFAVLTITG